MTLELVDRPKHVPPDRVVDFDIYAPPGVADDFHMAWKTLQSEGRPSIVWTPHNGGHWLVTRGRVINEVMSDYTRFSSKSIIIPKQQKANRLLPIMVDPPEHGPFRILLNSSLSPKAISRAEARIRQTAIELIEQIRLAGQCDFVASYADLLPIHIFLRMAALSTTDAPLLKTFSDAINRPDPNGDWGDDGTPFAWAVRHLFEYLSPIIDERTGKDGDDILSRLVNGKIGSRALTKEEALQLCTQTVVGGIDTVANFLGFVMLHLARAPADRRELVDNPGTIPAAVEELLRRYPIVTIGREVLHDVEYEGVLLKRGDMIATPTPLAGLDDKVNDEALKVDFHRSSGEHSTFGSGSHRCPGAHLARTELRISLEEWLSRIPDFALAEGHDVRYIGGLTATVREVHLTWDPASTRSPQ
jgi:camphor 5-monooxygenase